MRCAVTVITLAARRISPRTGAGSATPPACSAASAWRASSSFIWATMARDEFDFGLAVDLMRKDLGLAFDEARGNGATLPVTALVDQFLADVQGLGGGRQDPSALIRRLAKPD